MPVLSIKWPLNNIANEVDEKGRKLLKLKLNDEWTIICVAQALSIVCWMVNSIEIHRKNVTGELLVSGEITFEEDGAVLLREKVSQFIKTGSSFIVVSSNCSNLFIRNLHASSRINGFLNILEANEKQPTSLKNNDSRIQLNSYEELSKDFEGLLNPDSSCFADVTLKCDNVSIPAHKNILSARSPVFAAMFAHPMKESLKNEVDVTDIDLSTLRALLKYLYTGRTSDLTASSAADLLSAADMYQLSDLKAVCTYVLKDTVSLQNVWKILVMGDMYSKDLKSFAVDYVCIKCSEFSIVENMQEWKNLRKERPDLAMDLLESLVKYREKNLKKSMF